MATVINSQNKQFMTTTNTVESSITAFDNKNDFESSWIKSASSSRRSSLAAPPGISLPPQNNGKIQPKLTRAASVSFIPQLSKDSSSNNYLHQLAEATSLMQASRMDQNNWKTDIWSNNEDMRPNSGWGNRNETGFKTNLDFNLNSSLPFQQPRRMSLNPVSNLLPNRSRTPSYINNVLINYDSDNTNLTKNYGNTNFNGYSISDSLSSPSLATQSTMGSTDSINTSHSTSSNRFSRRFSLAPQFGIDLDYEDQITQQMDNLMLQNYTSILGRRHSVAASAFPVRDDSLTPYELNKDIMITTQNNNNNNNNANINSYNMELNNQHINSMMNENYFIVEFKHDRIDAYYAPIEMINNYKVGDLVIVEADRGQDLGKIVMDKVNSIHLQQLQQEFRMKMADIPKQFEPKKIYRHAHPTEVSQLVNKAQDEAKALHLCNLKLNQHNLNMQVLEAEYQWDRRKLTFFYKADERVDFRELVRELFKVYKTRIWMRALLS